MNIEFKGKVIRVHDTVQVKDNFKKRDCVVEVTETYTDKEGKPKTITNTYSVQFTGANCDKLNNIRAGENVTIKGKIKSSSYTDKRTGETKYMTQLEAWYISKN